MNTKNNPQKRNDNPLNKMALGKARAVAPKFCEQCGTAYKDSDFHLVQETQHSLIFHLKCSKCKSTYILNVSSPAPHLLASQKSKISLDLEDAKELTKFAGSSAISINEILDVYNELQKKDIRTIIKKLQKEN